MKTASLLLLFASSLHFIPQVTAQDTPNAPSIEPSVVHVNPSTKKSSLPHMELLSPLKRKDVSLNRLATAPCGGTLRGPIHFETAPGARNMVSWKIIHPAQNGRCLIKVGDSPREKDLVVVKPVDGSGDDDGSFPCGREVTNFEGKEFKLPKHVECDSCVLQLIWITDDGDQYRCVDFESTGAEVPECYGQCLNDGVCRNGKCACAPGFTGTNCQYQDEPSGREESAPVRQVSSSSNDDTLYTVYAVLILAIIGLFVSAFIIWKKKAGEAQERQNDGLTHDNDGAPKQKSKLQSLYEYD